ncbi:MAG: HesA/MoeB/ThiF family protein [Pseudomonadota bacterium]
MSRYARQIAVPEFGPASQERLANASVLVVGAGGLAAPLLPYLAAAGVGEIRIVDPDRVEESNLHRQTLFRVPDIGNAKAMVAADSLHALNPDCHVTPKVAALGPANASRLCAGVDLVLDCADSFAASYILSDTCQQTGTPLISASVIGLAGYVGAFCGGGPSLRAIFPELPGTLGSCAEDGVLGPVVGVIGSLQAQFALSHLAGIAPGVGGRFIRFDAATWRFAAFEFTGAPEPEFRPRFIEPDAIDAGDFVVDLRAPEEGPILHPAARRHTASDFGQGGPVAEPGQRVVLGCRSGLRAWTAAQRLHSERPGPIALIALSTTNGDVT